MAEALVVFIAGIGGVFLGMACLYISIKIISGVITRLHLGEGEK